MPRENLRMLEADVERLLFAGGAAAAADAGLRKRAETLAAFGARVPALGRLAEQARRITGATPREAAGELLTLAAMVGQVRGAQAAPTGVEGDIGSLDTGNGGPTVETAMAAGEVEALHQTLTRRAGVGRAAAIHAAALHPAVGDLRLLDAWMNALGDPAVGSLVAREVLPRLGHGVAGALRGALDLDGGAVDSRRLLCVSLMEGAAARPLVERALSQGAPLVRAAAVEALAGMDHPAAVSVALGMAAGDHAWEVRAAAVEVLAGAVSGRGGQGAEEAQALEVVLGALADEAPRVAQTAAGALVASVLAGVTQRVAELLSAEGSTDGDPGPGALPQGAKGGTGAAGGAGLEAQQAALRAEQDAARRVEARGRYMERVLGVLAARGGEVAAAAARGLTAHPHPVVRDAACAAIVALRDAEGLAALAAGVAAADPARRQVAVRAVFAMGPLAAYETLSGCFSPEALRDGGGAVVADVFEQLLYGEGVRAVDPRWADLALGLLAEPEAQGWAIDYLRVSQDPRAVEAFLARLGHPGADHPSLLDALGELGDRRATAPVAALLAAPRVPLWWVLHALERLDDPAAVDALRAEADALPAAVGQQVEALVARLSRDRTLDGT